MDIANINTNAYIAELGRLYDDLQKTYSMELEETASYSEFINSLGQLIAKFENNVERDKAYSILNEGFIRLNSLIEKYKRKNKHCACLSQRTVTRIKLMNRIQCLSYQFVESVVDPVKDINYKCGEKLVQSCLIHGIESNKPEKYLEPFFNSVEIYEGAKEMIELKPFVALKGKSVAMSDREILIRMPSPQVLDIVCRALERTPDQFIQMLGTYVGKF